MDSDWNNEGTRLGSPSSDAVVGPAAAPKPSFMARTGRWTMRLVLIFLFLQLGLWMFIGRKSLIHMVPEMILDDVRSVAALGRQLDGNEVYPERVYIISNRLAEAIGDARLYRLESSLSRFNGVLDFIFVANQPTNWKVASRILTQGFPSTDDDMRSDHRPLEGRVLISE